MALPGMLLAPRGHGPRAGVPVTDPGAPGTRWVGAASLWVLPPCPAPPSQSWCCQSLPLLPRKPLLQGHLVAPHVSVSWAAGGSAPGDSAPGALWGRASAVPAVTSPLQRPLLRLLGMLGSPQPAEPRLVRSPAPALLAGFSEPTRSEGWSCCAARGGGGAWCTTRTERPWPGCPSGQRRETEKQGPGEGGGRPA